MIVVNNGILVKSILMVPLAHVGKDISQRGVPGEFWETRRLRNPLYKPEHGQRHSHVEA